jgi:hypothetical protein
MFKNKGMSKKIFIRIILFTTVCAVCFAFGSKQIKQEHKYAPSDGFVPNQETAIKIAEAIWFPIYGDEIYTRKPFKATLKADSIWVVQGTLTKGKGGVPYIEMQKSDCRILKVTHGK